MHMSQEYGRREGASRAAAPACAPPREAQSGLRELARRRPTFAQSPSSAARPTALWAFAAERCREAERNSRVAGVRVIRVDDRHGDDRQSQDGSGRARGRGSIIEAAKEIAQSLSRHNGQPAVRTYIEEFGITRRQFPSPR
jgi:hypothetical protein